MDAPGTLTPLAAAPLAATRDHLVGIAPLVIGLVIVGVLIFAVAYGMRLRQRGDMRPSSPTPGQPPHAVGSEDHRLRPDEMPHDGRRRFPYEVRDSGVTETDPGEDEPPPRWHEGGSGSFGSGGFGSRR